MGQRLKIAYTGFGKGFGGENICMYIDFIIKSSLRKTLCFGMIMQWFRTPKPQNAHSHAVVLTFSAFNCDKS